MVPPFCSYNSISSTLFQIFVLFCSSNSNVFYRAVSTSECERSSKLSECLWKRQLHFQWYWASAATSQQLGSDQMFRPMSHYKGVSTEALIHLEASASGTNAEDLWWDICEDTFLWQKAWITVPVSSKSWISRWFRTLLASVIFWMLPHLDNCSLGPGQLFTFPTKKHSFSAAMSFKSSFKPQIIFVSCNLADLMLTCKAFYSLQCVKHVACRNVSNTCNRANANTVSLLHQCKVWGAYPMWPLNVSKVNKWYINKYQIMARMMPHTWIIYVALLTDIQIQSKLKSSV